MDVAPQLYMQTSVVLEDGEAKLEAAYAASKAVTVEARAEEAKLTFAYDDFGPAGNVASRTRIEDLDATLVVFENNVRLNMKKTDFEDNVIRLSARIGAGTLSAPTDVDSPFARYLGVDAHAIDPAEAARLWTLSAELTGVDAFA